MIGTLRLTVQQQRFLKLLFKFRFVSSYSLSVVLGIRKDTTYRVLEDLVRLELVVKVYEPQYRVYHKPAYYYLSHAGVRKVRELLGVTEPIVHALYKNAEMSAEFVSHCLDVVAIYPILMRQVPAGTELFTKAELGRFTEFPKNRPDLYIRTPDHKEAIVVLAHDYAPYVVRKRLNEIVTHSEDEGWEGDYPCIAFILKDKSSMLRLLYGTAKRLDSMGIDIEDLQVLGTNWEDVGSGHAEIWCSVYDPKKAVSLFG